MKLNDRELELVLGTALFKNSTHVVVRSISEEPDARVKVYRKGDIVYDKKDFAHALGIVLTGKLRVTKENADGRPMVMSTLSEGALFGAAALYNHAEEYVTTISAVEQSKVFFLPQTLMNDIMQRFPELAENYIRYLSERILFLNRKIYFLTAGTAEQRLAGFILDNFVEGEPAQMPMQMSMLADALNMSRASLYRGLETLLESGGLEKKGKLFVLSSSEKIRKFIK